jgi:hypothetical protein
VHALFLDLAALVAGFHRAQHTAAFGDLLELGQRRLFHQFGELVDDEGVLVGVLVFARALPVSAVDAELEVLPHVAPTMGQLDEAALT